MRRLIGKLILWFLKGQRIHVYNATIIMGMEAPCQIIGEIKSGQEDEFGEIQFTIEGKDIIK